MKKLLAIVIIAMFLVVANIGAQDFLALMKGAFENQLMVNYGDFSNFDTNWQSQPPAIPVVPDTNQAYVANNLKMIDTFKFKPSFDIFKSNSISMKFAFEDRIVTTMDNTIGSAVAPITLSNCVRLTTENRIKPQFQFTILPNSTEFKWEINIMPEERSTVDLLVGNGAAAYDSGNIAAFPFRIQIPATATAGGYKKTGLYLSFENEAKVYISPTEFIGIRPKLYYVTTFEEGKNTAINLYPEFDLRTPSWDDSDLLKNNFTTMPKILKGLAFRLRESIQIAIQPQFFKDTWPNDTNTTTA